jgi:hypothetical protein
MNFSNLPIDETPIHVVMWKDATVFSQTTSSSTEVADLRRRVEELERIVQHLLNQEPPKANKSPFFKSTNVPEPIGIEIISKLDLNDVEETQSVKEVFDNLGKEKGKQVKLNGMTFDIRKYGTDVVYCEETTGRAFLDPQDAFTEPNKKHIGYWNAQDDNLSVRSEPFSDEEEEAIPETKVDVKKEDVKKEEANTKVEEEEEGEEEEEEESELEEFEYKGATYYKDADNQVYQADEDGEVDTENPIGVWNEQKQKVLKYKV